MNENAIRKPVECTTTIPDDDMAAHIDDSIASGELNAWDDPAFAALSEGEQSQVYRDMYPGDYGYYGDVA